MLSYFTTAGHRNYLRFETINLIKMKNLPGELLHKFHAMRHCNGLWNSIWSDMMIKMTALRHGHGPAGTIGIDLNGLEGWAKSFHVLIVLEQSLLGLKRNETNKSVTNHKEEPKARMKIDCTDCDKLRKYLATSIAPFSADGHPQELVHIHSGKLSSKEINVDSWKTIAKKQLQQFLSDLSDGFYKHFTAAALTMKKNKRSV